MDRPFTALSSKAASEKLSIGARFFHARGKDLLRPIGQDARATHAGGQGSQDAMNKLFAGIQRPSATTVDRYRTVLLGQLIKHLPPGQLMDDAIKPLGGHHTRIVGPALTVGSEYPDFMMGILATGVAQAGDVIVVAPEHHAVGAAWGAGLTISTDILGCEGVVVDGLVTDAHNILACTTPVFSRGATLRTRDNDQHGSVNIEILCGGVRVHPGDLIIADLDGGCVVPRADIERLIDPVEAASRQILAGGAQMRVDKATIFDRMGGRGLAAELGVEWVD